MKENKNYIKKISTFVYFQNDYFAKAVQCIESYAKSKNRKHLVTDICS